MQPFLTSVRGIVAEQLVLGRAGQGDVAGDAPGRLAGVEGRALEFVGIFARCGRGGWVLCAFTQSIFSWVMPSGSWMKPSLSDRVSTLPPSWTIFSAAWVATLPEPEMTARLAGQILPSRLQHVLEEIDRAIAGRLGADQRAAIFEALAGQHAGELVGDALVLAEHIADLAAADADVAGRHVHVGADMAVELGHEALAEAHDLAVALALGIEVGAALAAAHRQAGQRVLEGLLEGEELEDRSR